MPLPHDTAKAKINLFLHITGRRNDGYHFVDSLAVFAHAADRISLIELPHKTQTTIATLTIDGPYAASLTDCRNNLITRAATLLHQTAHQHGYHLSSLKPVSFHLHKSLPVASGIGGGSADAACALRLLSHYWHLPPELASQIASQLGADVAVCLHQRPSRMEGIGDILSPISSMPPMGMILVNPGVSVSTSSIFTRLAQSEKRPKSADLSFPHEGWRTLADLIAFLQKTENDLQPHAIAQEPIIQTVLETLHTLPDVAFVRMSGSGATCFALFENTELAEKAHHILKQQSHTYAWWSWVGTA